MNGLLFSCLIEKSLETCSILLLGFIKCFDGSFNFLESNFKRIFEVLHKLDIAFELLVDKTLFFSFFLQILIGLDDRNYWFQITEVPKFQANVSISMILREVIEASTVVDLDSLPICFIDYVFCDISKVL